MSAENIIDIYKFEGNLEVAYKGILVASDLTVIIPGDVALQQSRPRVEAEVNNVVETSDNYEQKPTAEEWRNVGYRGQLALDCWTNSGDGNDGNIGLHRAYVAQVRNAMASAYSRLLVATFHPFYVINQFVCNGTTPTVAPEKGYFKTSLIYDFNFTIRPDAWPQT